MRMGPFSDAGVISLLNQFFVPIYTSNEEYRQSAPTSLAEIEIKRLGEVHKRFESKGMSCGAVHVFILKPNGEPLGSLHVREASELKILIPFLQKFIEHEEIQPGDTLVAPKVQSVPPQNIPEGSRLLHLTSRAPTEDGPLETTEDWIVLSAEAWKELAPDRKLSKGEKWEVSRETSETILTNFYPYSQNWNTNENEISSCSLRAEVLPRPANAQETTVAVRGQIVMMHKRQPTYDLREVNSDVVGFVRIPDDGSAAQLMIVTGQSTYGPQPFAVLVESVTAESASRIIEK